MTGTERRLASIQHNIVIIVILFPAECYYISIHNVMYSMKNLQTSYLCKDLPGMNLNLVSLLQ